MATPVVSTAMATLVLTLLALPFQTVLSAKTGGRDCSVTCGGHNYGIPYPFGIGPECSLPGFDLTCASDKYNFSSLFLGNTSIRVLSKFPPGYHYPAMLTSVGYSVNMTPGVRDYSFHWEAPGRPFAISASSNMALFVVGCDIKASLFVGDSGVEVKAGNCSAFCVEDKIMGKLPPICIGIGCCRINITMTLRAFTLNILEQVQAFVTYENGYQFRTWDLGFDLSEAYDAELSWAIPYQPNCERAVKDKSNYTCISDHSECLDSPIGGYVCNCKEGFIGNPYILNGCVEHGNRQDNIMQPNKNCPTSCGNLSVPFPFGTEVGCFAKPPLHLTCRLESSSSPKMPSPPMYTLRLPDGSVVTEISVDEGTLHVLKPVELSTFLREIMDPMLYTMSGEWGVVNWAVDNMTCQDAMASKKGYRCVLVIA